MRIGIDARAYSNSSSPIGAYVRGLIHAIEKTHTSHEYTLFLDQKGMEECKIVSPKFRKILVRAPFNSFQEQSVFPLAIAKEWLDIMHFTSFHSPLFFSRKSIVTIQDLAMSFYPDRHTNGSFGRFIYKKILRTTTKRAKHIIAASTVIKKDLVETLDISASNISVIHPGVDTEKLPSKTSTLEIQQLQERLWIRSPKFLLYYGEFKEHKNLVRLIEAFSRVSNKYSDTDLVLIGKEDAKYRDIRDAVIRLGLAGRVRLPGDIPTTDKVKLLRVARAYIQPSLYEGFDISVIEALSAGVPVACSKTSSFKEILGEENATFFNPLSVESMSEALEYTMNRSKTKNPNISTLTFDWKTAGEKTIELYERFGESTKKVSKKKISE